MLGVNENLGIMLLGYFLALVFRAGGRIVGVDDSCVDGGWNGEPGGFQKSAGTIRASCLSCWDGGLGELYFVSIHGTDSATIRKADGTK